MQRSTKRERLLVFAQCSLVAVVAFSGTVLVRSAWNYAVQQYLLAQLESPDESRRSLAAEGLKKRGVDLHDRLLRLLQHPHAEVRRFAGEQLCGDIPISEEVVQAFTKIVRDPVEDPELRHCAIYTLGKVGQRSHGPVSEREAAILQALCVALADRDPTTGACAAGAVSQFGPRASDTVPALLEAVRGPHATVRVLAADALIEVDDTQLELAISVLVPELDSNDEVARGFAGNSLAELGATARYILPELEAAAESHPDRAAWFNSIIVRIQNSEAATASP